MKNLTLITGGARSGKSTFAESLATSSNKSIYYFATMKHIDSDLEQTARIEKHRRRRPDNWTTIEATTDLSQKIQDIPQKPILAIIDCLSLFVTSILFEGENIDDKTCADINIKSFDNKEKPIIETTKKLLSSINNQKDIDFIVVTNEVGSGIVPTTPLGRAFRDYLGIVNQIVAKEADTVWLLCSGIPVKIKPQ